MAELTLTAIPTVAACGPAVPAGFSYNLFGGGVFTLPQLPYLQDELDLYLSAVREVAGQLSPMVPGIKLVKAVAAVGLLVEHLPQNIATLNVAAITQDAQNVAVSIADIAEMAIFPVALASTALAFRRTLVGFLEALRSRLLTLIAAYGSVDGLIAKAASIGNAFMAGNAQCARENLDTEVNALRASMGPAVNAVVLFNVIVCLVTLGAVHAPVLPTIGPDLTEAVAAIQPIIDVLNALPLPDGPAGSFTC
jgi:hypothetical protein